MSHEYSRDTIQMIADDDVAQVWKKDQSYSRSWKRRGGIGAFMMLARKWDRLEAFCERCDMAWDIFRAIFNYVGDGRDGTPLAEVRDLRRYLLLVEAEMVARGVVKGPYESKCTGHAHEHLVVADIRKRNAHGIDQEHPFGFDPVEDMPRTSDGD